MIEQAESLLNEENKYTESSFNILKDALAKANATLTDSHSKIELEKALQDLQVAIDGLTEKPKEPTDPERPDPEPEREDKVISRPQISNGKATISSKDVAKLADKGQLVIDITDVDAVEEVYLTAEQVRELKQKNAQIIIEKRDIHITFPSTYLSGEEDVVIKIEAVSTAEYTIPQNKSLVGHIYKLTISEGDTLVNKFSSENPVTLSFAVDKNSVKNPEQLGVFYFNTDDSDWVDLGGEYADNFITVTTDHLSAFAVMEVEEISDNHEKPGKGKDPIIDHDDDQSDKDGEELPKTATSMYTMLFAGFVLIVLATVSLIVFRRKKEMTDL